MSSSMGYVISEFLISIWFELFKRIPVKPFSCGYCLSFWIGGMIAIFEGFLPLYVFGIACISAVLNAFIYKFLR